MERTKLANSLLKDVTWRAMTAYDLGAVEDIAGTVHPGFYEAPEILAERQSLYRNGCYLLEIGEKPAGYVLSHPWRDTPPALNTPLGELPADASTYYLHDLALLPVARRVGAAGRIVEALIKHATAQGFASMTLIAVNGSQSFWERHGFAVADRPELGAKLESYEPSAKLMVRPLKPVAGAPTSSLRARLAPAR
ncbi:MAG TPA: GNAT family N-acetyltransferase [Devosia sp.]|nr:GNAT family N-acetyltransferase [Devosia sp.]